MSAQVMPFVNSTAFSAYQSVRQQRSDWQFTDEQEVTPSVHDSVDISEEAIEKHRIMKMVDTFDFIYKSPAQRETKTLEEVGQDLQENLADFTGLLGDFFRQSGIGTEKELVLKPDFEGSIETANRHPDAKKVDALFDRESALTARFMVIAARSSLLEAAATNPEFRADYRQDARASIREHIDLLADRLENFRLSVKDGELAPTFADA